MMVGSGFWALGGSSKMWRVFLILGIYDQRKVGLRDNLAGHAGELDDPGE
jgi:hypothetical protein